MGLDARADRLAAFRWHRPTPPTLADLLSELAGRGVRRFVLGHATGRGRSARRGGGPSRRRELLVAGGVTDLEGVRRVRDSGAAGIILGEALLSGAIDYQSAPGGRRIPA